MCDKEMMPLFPLVSVNCAEAPIFVSCGRKKWCFLFIFGYLLIDPHFFLLFSSALGVCPPQKAAVVLRTGYILLPLHSASEEEGRLKSYNKREEKKFYFFLAERESFSTFALRFGGRREG
jgi:hypothetical protein